MTTPLLPLLPSMCFLLEVARSLLLLLQLLSLLLLLLSSRLQLYVLFCRLILRSLNGHIQFRWSDQKRNGLEWPNPSSLIVPFLRFSVFESPSKAIQSEALLLAFQGVHLDTHLLQLLD